MKTTDRNYDLQGLGNGRVFANFMRWKLLPFGDIGDGPGVVWLLSIGFRHRFGRMIAGYRIRRAARRDRRNG